MYIIINEVQLNGDIWGIKEYSLKYGRLDISKFFLN